MRAGHGQVAPHRRDGLIDQTLFEYRTVEGPTDERGHHRLSQCRPPLSPNQKCERIWTLPAQAIDRPLRIFFKPCQGKARLTLTVLIWDLLADEEDYALLFADFDVRLE
jgi:hypothetical protein